MAEEVVDCAIIGGGPVGLFTSIVLSRLGIRSHLLEKHPGTTIHPKARNVNISSLERMRSWKEGSLIREMERVGEGAAVDQRLAGGGVPAARVGLRVDRCEVGG
eukprot:COSAG04_NODE_637_length_11700_cov_478.131885_5_plen_104_part_00